MITWSAPNAYIIIFICSVRYRHSQMFSTMKTCSPFCARNLFDQQLCAKFITSMFVESALQLSHNTASWQIRLKKSTAEIILGWKAPESGDVFLQRIIQIIPNFRKYERVIKNLRSTTNYVSIKTHKDLISSVKNFPGTSAGEFKEISLFGVL